MPTTSPTAAVPGPTRLHPALTPSIPPAARLPQSARLLQLAATSSTTTRWRLFGYLGFTKTNNERTVTGEEIANANLLRPLIYSKGRS